MRRHATRKHSVLLAVLAAFAGLAIAAGSAAGDVSEFGLRSVEASLSDTQAAGHADLTTTFSVKGDASESDPFGNPKPFAETRDVEVQLPPGFVANLGGFTPCPLSQFSTALAGDSGEQGPGECGAASQIGVVHFSLYAGVQNATASLYELDPPQGADGVARFGFWAAIAPVIIDVSVDPRRGYAATATAEGLTAARTVLPATVATTIWGDPTSPSHDGERPTPFEGAHCGGSCGEPREAGESPTAFARNSTMCSPSVVSFAADSYQVPGVFDTAIASLPLTTGCGLVPFEPSLSLQPTTHAAGSSSGVDFDLALPQEALTRPGEVSTSDLKKAVLRLPEGVGLNASAVEGLGSCSESEIGLVSEAPPVFSGSEPSCPESSKVGSVTIATPILGEPLNGSLYVAKQTDNPFHSLLAGYLVAKANGIVLKLAGKFELSPSGRITAVFDDNPQAPFSEMELHLKGGPHGVITMPSRCGTYQTEYELTPWSGNAPTIGTSSFTVDQGCNVGFAPGFQAGTTNPVAGAYSPFTVRLTREAGAPQLVGLDVSPPEGLVAKLAGIPRCSDAVIASIPTATESGAGEIASPSCPAASQLGTVLAGAGSGMPFFVDTGKVYLAGPYKGAPLSLAVVTPALAGPFDLGNVVVRVALKIDPDTARVTAISDALPTVVQGVALDLRDLRIDLSRPGFVLNPTDCRQMRVDAILTAASAETATPSARFQVADCASLPFRPQLALRLKGPTNRRAHPQLIANLTAKPGEANIARAQVKLPRAAFLDNAHIGTVCTRVQFAARSCPPASIYGKATATTPLLDYPLSGPVYLRSSSHELPDLVAELRGPGTTPIEVDLDGKTDSVKGALRNTFEAVPDAPVSKFHLELFGGKRGLIELSSGLCKGPRAQVKLAGQNGKLYNTTPVVRSSCRATGKTRHSKRSN